MKLTSYLVAITWYIIFGFIHELSHLIAASLFSEDPAQIWKSVDWIDLIFNRRLVLDLDSLSLPDVATTGIGTNYIQHEEEKNHRHEDILFVIRQCGWVTSVVIALLAYFFYHRHSTTKVPTTLVSSSDCDCRPDYHDGGKFKFNYCSSSLFLHWCQLAAIVTAMDAIWTDLLQMDPCLSFFMTKNSSNFIHDNTEPSTTSTTNVLFFCGNFGVILLHSAWYYDDHGGKTALEILRKMIEVTMMRGAQSGGIVTFKHNNRSGGMDDDDGDQNLQMKSIRSRVVKSKRGDL